MGTRSLTVMIQNEWEKEQEVCVLYRQYDGYVSGHGHELAKFLMPFTVTNGIRLLQTAAQTANGASCLFAQLIANFKTEVGQFYLHQAGARDMGEEYTYYVTAGHGKPTMIRVEAYGEEIFNGTPEELLNFKEE